MLNYLRDEIGEAFGSVTRFPLSSLIAGQDEGSVPSGTIVITNSSSFLTGLQVGLLTLEGIG